MMQSSKRIIEKYLVTFSRLGDRGAQEQLVNRYQKKFLGHAYRLLGDTEQARDAVQEGWIDILRGLPKLQDDSAFSAWAFRIITRKCSKHIAGLKKNRVILRTVSDESEPDHMTEDEIERAADRRPLQEALAKLPAEHRAAVALFYLEDMSVAEVAVSLDIPAGTVKSRLMSARKKLRAALEGEDHGYTR
jgi:RNA polymerase sigma-70 factor (ECF subfamily)